MASRRYTPAHRRRRRRTGGLGVRVLGRRRSPSELPTRTLISSAQVLLGRSFPTLGIFVAGIFVARALGPGAYGRYAAAYALGALTVAGITAGIPVLAQRRSAEGDLDKATVFRAARLQVALSVPGVALAAILGALVLGGQGGAVTAMASGLGAATNGFATLGQGVQSGRRQYSRTAATDITVGLLIPILTYGALRVHGGIDGTLVAIALASGVSCFVAWTGLPNLVFGRTPTPLRARDSIPFTVLGILNAGYAQIDSTVLLVVAGSQATGLYSAGERILGPFGLIGSAFVTIYLSGLSGARDNRERWRRIRRVGAVALTSISAIGIIMLFVTCPLIIHLVYGPRFDASVGPARILLLSVIPWSLYWPKYSELASLHREKYAALVLVAGLGLDFALVAVLGHRLGADGAAWSWVVSESVMLFGLTRLTRGSRARSGALL